MPVSRSVLTVSIIPRRPLRANCYGINQCFLNGSKQISSRTEEYTANGSDVGHNQICADNTYGFFNFNNTDIITTKFPEGNMVLTSTCSEASGYQSSGQSPIPLTWKAGDAIYQNLPSDGYYFQGTYLGDTPFNLVYDTSPLGEVFVAKSDLSVVIHKPLPGGMQKLVLPPNIVKLLAALWL